MNVSVNAAMSIKITNVSVSHGLLHELTTKLLIYCCHSALSLCVCQITINLLEATKPQSVPAVIPGHYSVTLSNCNTCRGVARLLRPL